MRTKWMMSGSAACMGALGLAATFLPQEIVTRLGVGGGGPVVLLVQLTGGLYLGFAILNWFARDLAIGGIYNRPIVTGNLLHFTVGGLALAKSVAGGMRQPGLLALTLVYSLLAIWFALTMFHSPTRDGED